MTNHLHRRTFLQHCGLATVAVAMGRDNRLVFVDADGGVATTDVDQVRQIVWTHDGDHLITVHSNGTARWWPAAVLR